MAVWILAQEQQDASLFLGDNLPAWLLLAFGGALFFGNLAAILRPPQSKQSTPASGARQTRPTKGARPAKSARPAKGANGDGTLDQAPLGRSLAMAGVGLVAAIWALISLVT